MREDAPSSRWHFDIWNEKHGAWRFGVTSDWFYFFIFLPYNFSYGGHMDPARSWAGNRGRNHPKYFPFCALRSSMLYEFG